MGSMIIAVLFLSALSIVVHGQDFNAARKAVVNEPRSINYTSFCQTTKTGGDKLACRIKSVPLVGFLVCKTPKIDGLDCKGIIDKEIENLQEIKSAGVKTVEVSPPSISNVTCGEMPNSTCSGFLEAWISNDIGQFQHIRDRIVNNQIEELIADVKRYTPQSSLNTTGSDIANIKKFMQVDPTKDKYKQICDLQGFFLKKGGFLVNDTPLIEELGRNDSCPADEGELEPTTGAVLQALDEMVDAFGTLSDNKADLETGNILLLFISYLMYYFLI